MIVHKKCKVCGKMFIQKHLANVYCKKCKKTVAKKNGNQFMRDIENEVLN